MNSDRDNMRVYLKELTGSWEYEGTNDIKRINMSDTVQIDKILATLLLLNAIPPPTDETYINFTLGKGLSAETIVRYRNANDDVTHDKASAVYMEVLQLYYEEGDTRFWDEDET